MEKNRLTERILRAKNPYTPPLSREADGEAPLCAVRGSVKCEEGAFLLLTDDGPVFLDQAAEKDTWPLTHDLDGWTAEIAFSQDTVLPCTFNGETLRWENAEIPVQCRKPRERLYLVFSETEDGSMLLVLDTARFLVYGAIGGTLLGGYIRNMPQDR
ncbi:MAG: hypothetical protein IKH30_05395 [Clostridia bacterium]|nr:hypothetical protein [Clostridia bacterium]